MGTLPLHTKSIVGVRCASTMLVRVKGPFSLLTSSTLHCPRPLLESVEGGGQMEELVGTWTSGGGGGDEGRGGGAGSGSGSGERSSLGAAMVVLDAGSELEGAAVRSGPQKS